MLITAVKGLQCRPTVYLYSGPRRVWIYRRKKSARPFREMTGIQKAPSPLHKATILKILGCRFSVQAFEGFFSNFQGILNFHLRVCFDFYFLGF
jgi:hypothetical protein